MKLALQKQKSDIAAYAKVLLYPGGFVDICASNKPDFKPGGWEAAEDWSRPARRLGEQHPEGERPDPEEENSGDNSETNLDRSMRRARAMVRRLALANEFKYFVTLTLDASKVDRYDPKAIIRKLNSWANNQVERKGLCYVLVPEAHKDGAWHFHGFFNDALPMVDSGTIKIAGSKKPRKPRSKAERERWLNEGGHIVYNCPAWSMGFSTAMELWGDYRQAVAYVCKYIGKDSQRPAGRWYYSGGGLAKPETFYADMTAQEASEQFGKMAYQVIVPGRTLAIINGFNLEGGNFDGMELEF